LRNIFFGVLAASLVLTGVGCKRRPVQVSGVVLLDNKPLKGAMLTFNPVDKEGRAATAYSRNDGSFDVTTYTEGDGAFPGDYKITVSAPTPSSSGSQERPNLDMRSQEGYKNFLKIQQRTAAEQQRRGVREKKDPAGPKHVYGELDKTPLKCRVPTDGTLTVKLESERGGR
jgi:hypothetical protein